jgi:hypothetical protein
MIHHIVHGLPIALELARSEARLAPRYPAVFRKKQSKLSPALRVQNLGLTLVPSMPRAASLDVATPLDPGP